MGDNYVVRYIELAAAARAALFELPAGPIKARLVELLLDTPGLAAVADGRLPQGFELKTAASALQGVTGRCLECGSELPAKRKPSRVDRKYCSGRCRVRALRKRRAA